MEIVGIPSARIDDAAPVLGPYLDTFAKLSRNSVTADMLREELKARERQAWLVVGDEVLACFLTRIVGDAPKTAEITFCEGREMAAWTDLVVETVKAWGAENGAAIISVPGRIGWERVLKPRGFKRARVTMEAEIG